VLGHYCRQCLVDCAPFPLKGGEGGRGGSDGRVYPGKPGERLEPIPAPAYLEFDPDWVSPPGETIKDMMAEKGLESVDVAIQLDLDDCEFTELLIGRAELTDELAAKLASVLGGTEQFWKQREADYRKALQR
jgi:plasmid maintenance system antidote protein VapI